ncbi:hypothetical protein EYM_01205 [Ignicoccus islandicus DSM 13165]|uniref:Uncharacterized protein n=1 Tax=Ignicoccus islandicus DSM 13165 TaxID=940295 RepID=A0A0U3G1I7_9CREN|nr:hypothetical protein [Ignicoccus islandicus]ALU12188.1 hypothetical protein EYM_01205 [Ignicoccus islandicus DSM 13165]
MERLPAGVLYLGPWSGNEKVSLGNTLFFRNLSRLIRDAIIKTGVNETFGKHLFLESTEKEFRVGL